MEEVKATPEHPPSPTSSSSSSSSSSISMGKGRKKELKSEKSVVYDNDKEAWMCRHCGWTYPNVRPTAKERREHRRHCSDDKFRSVQEWLSGGDKHQEDSNKALEQDVANGCSPAETSGKETDLKLADATESQKLNEEETSEICQEEVARPVEEKGRSGHMEIVQLTQDEGRKERVEYIEPSTKMPPEDSNNVLQQNFDLEKVIRQQTTHDLFCPNCNSCITKRVILRKRKRISSDVRETDPEPEAVETIQEETRQAEDSTQESGETEYWGCMSCFTIFYRRVRGVRLCGLNELFQGGDSDNEGATARETTTATRRRLPSCLPFSLPWTDEERDEQREEATEKVQEIEILVDLSKPGQPVVEVPAERRNDSWFSNCIPSFSAGEEQAPLQQRPRGDGTTHFSCVPILLPEYWKEDDSGHSSKASCLPVVLPAYWGSTVQGEAGATTVSERDRVSCFPLEVASCLPLQWRQAQVNEATEEQTPGQEITRSDGSTHFSCVPILLPEYWKADDSGRSGNPSCLPAILPAYWGITAQEEPGLGTVSEGDRIRCFPWQDSGGANACLPLRWRQAQVDEDVSRSNAPRQDAAGSSCLPILLPAYQWTSSEENIHQGERAREPSNSADCFSQLLPSYQWRTYKEGEQYRLTLEKSETDVEPVVQASQMRDGARDGGNSCMPYSLLTYSWRVPKVHSDDSGTQGRQYVTKETSVRAFIKTITNVVTLKSRKEGAVKETRQIGKEEVYVDLKLEDDRRDVSEEDVSKTLSKTAVLKDEEDEGAHLIAKTAVLEDEEDEETHLIDRRQSRGAVQEITEEPKAEEPKARRDTEPSPTPMHSKPALLEDDLVKSREVDARSILSTIIEQEAEGGRPADASEGAATTTMVSVKGPDSVVQVRGEDAKETVQTAISIAEDIGVIPGPPAEGRSREYVKSIVYGGLDVLLTSLAVVSAGAGAGTKTTKLLALGLANLVSTFFVFIHNTRSMYATDRALFDERVGQSLWVNGGISVVSFLVFGSVAPVTYAASYAKLDDRDYKFMATSLASLACLVALAAAKAYVSRQRVLSTVATLLVTGFVASVTGYFVGDWFSRWLHKAGLNNIMRSGVDFLDAQLSSV